MDTATKDTRMRLSDSRVSCSSSLTLQPVYSAELPSTSRTIWTSEDFARRTADRPVADMEEAELLLELQQERLFGSDNRLPSLPFRSLGRGQELEDTQTRQQSGLPDLPVFEDFGTYYSRPLLQCRPAMDQNLSRYGSEQSLTGMREPQDASFPGRGQQQSSNRLQAGPLMENLTAATSDIRETKSMKQSSRAPSSKAGSITAGEPLSHRSSPVNSEFSDVTSLADSMHSAIQSAIERIDGKMADVSAGKIKASRKQARKQSQSTNQEKPGVMGNDGCLATQSVTDTECHSVATQPVVPRSLALQQGSLVLLAKLAYNMELAFKPNHFGPAYSILIMLIKLWISLLE